MLTFICLTECTSCLNIVAEPDGQAGCVLIRALEPVAGLRAMYRRRRAGAELSATLPPARVKLTRAWRSHARNNGDELTRGELVVRAPEETSAVGIEVTPRIGITKCADLPLRFIVKGNRFLSR